MNCPRGLFVTGGGVGLGLGLGVAASAKNSYRRFAGLGLNPAFRVSCLRFCVVCIGLFNFGFRVLVLGVSQNPTSGSTRMPVPSHLTHQLFKNASFRFVQCPRTCPTFGRQFMNSAENGLHALLLPAFLGNRFAHCSN